MAGEVDFFPASIKRKKQKKGKKARKLIIKMAA